MASEIEVTVGSTVLTDSIREGSETGSPRGAAMTLMHVPGIGAVLAIGDDDGAVRLREVAGDTTLGHLLTGHRGTVTAAASLALPDGRTLLATGADDSTVRLWNPKEG